MTLVQKSCANEVEALMVSAGYNREDGGEGYRRDEQRNTSPASAWASKGALSSCRRFWR